MSDRLSFKMNHVALSMHPGDIQGERRKEILRFYQDVFQWTEYQEDEQFVEQFSTELSSLLEEEVPAYDPLVLLTGSGQFVFLYGVPEPMKATPVDHFGFEVNSEEELDVILSRAKDFQSHDAEVRIVEKAVTSYDIDQSLRDRLPGKRVDLINCYIGYRLPFAVEVQFYRWDV
jgi:hypothetical protein